MPTLKSQISEFLVQSKMDDALDLVKQCALDACIEFDTPVTLIMADWNHLKKTWINGTITFEEEAKVRQTLIFRLLSLTEEMEKEIAKRAGLPVNAAPKHVILFLGANPFQKLALAIEREMEVISDGLLRFGKRDAFDFRAKTHVTPADLQRMLLETQGFKPRFVHFAGNAVVDHPDYGTGVIFEGENGQPRVVHGSVLASIFRQFPSVECVFLNTCDSGPSALIVGKDVKYAIGMNARVYDDVAIEFAVAFYEAIAGGNDVPFAFEFAKMRILLGSAPEQASLPILVCEGKCQDEVYIQGESHISGLKSRIMR